MSPLIMIASVLAQREAPPASEAVYVHIEAKAQYRLVADPDKDYGRYIAENLLAGLLGAGGAPMHTEGGDTVCGGQCNRWLPVRKYSFVDESGVELTEVDLSDAQSKRVVLSRVGNPGGLVLGGALMLGSLAPVIGGSLLLNNQSSPSSGNPLGVGLMLASTAMMVVGIEVFARSFPSWRLTPLAENREEVE